MQQGLKARRFTLQDGDLATEAGQVSLLSIILREEPEHVWLSPECSPFCNWSRFNMNRSLSCHKKIQLSRDQARVHLALCNLVAKLQIANSRHVHMESPWTAETWKQPELAEFLSASYAACLDQCQFGLKHPESHNPMQKKTRIQTTSRDMLLVLDSRVCKREHTHSQISGRCTWKGKSISVSRFAASYPRLLAKAIIKGVVATCAPPDDHAKCYVVDSKHPDEPPNKRPKYHNIQGPGSYSDDHDTQKWIPIFECLRKELPKSGIKTWTNSQHDFFKLVQSMMPEHRIGAIKAGKGLDKYIIGDNPWLKSLPRRRTLALRRFTLKIEDLGQDHWAKLSKQQQVRRAVPSHILVCVFFEEECSRSSNVPAQGVSEDPLSNPLQAEVSEDPMHAAGSQAKGHNEPPVPAVDVPPWTPLSATVSGPKFLSLSSEDQGLIRKLHVNLGHPTSEKLARHLREHNSQPEIVEGARDYLCASCAERSKPQLSTPGTLKDATEFNEQISLDAFEFTSKSGYTAHVLHMIDESTRFHIGQRCQPSCSQFIEIIKQNWIQWAGAPARIAHDQGGEFILSSGKTSRRSMLSGRSCHQLHTNGAE